MTQRFVIQDWAAFAPGIENRQAWLDWARRPFLPAGDAVPALSELPPLQRRRLDRLGRMALQVAYWVDRPRPAMIPMVFGSRHGDIHRTYQMLDELAQDQPLSPTAFGLSTHNAIAAQYAIASGFTGNYLSVAAGRFTPEAAITEALALLDEDTAEALVVIYDCLPPEAYARFQDEPGCHFAWAIRISKAEAGQRCYSVNAGVGNHPASDAEERLPHGLAALSFLLAERSEWQVGHHTASWCWRRHD